MKQTFCPPDPLRGGISKNPSLVDTYIIIGMHCQNFNPAGPAVWPVRCLSVSQSVSNGILLYIEIVYFELGILII